MVDSNELDVARVEIPEALAKTLEADGKFHEAYLYYNKARNAEKSIAFTSRFMQEGNKGERDLFIARIVMTYLAREEFVKAQQIRRAFASEAISPLLNLTDMLFDLIQLKDKDLFASIVKDTYRESVARDPHLISYLEKISQKYFEGVELKEKSQGLGAIISSLFNSS